MITDQKFWFRWMLNYSLGELIAIGAGASIGRFLFMSVSNSTASHNSPLTFIILGIAGSSEGIIIGYMQWKSLSRLISGFKLAPWLLTTTVSAAAGWMFILPPAIVFISFLSSLKLINGYYSAFYTALAGLAFGGVIGIPQYFIIRKSYRSALLWIVANGFAWMISFLIFYVGLQLFAYSTLLLQNVMIIILSCALSGLAQGIVMGTFIHFTMTLRSQKPASLVKDLSE